MSEVKKLIAFLSKLSSIRGRITPNAPMHKISWFRTGGLCDALFEPEDEEDLSAFLKLVPEDIPITTVGLGSNLLVREGGIRGFVIRLPMKGFGKAKILSDSHIYASAGCSGKSLSLLAFEHGIEGFHFYSGIPGSIGGALRMNAGANGIETSDRVRDIRAIDRKGVFHTFDAKAMGYSYRDSSAPEGMIFLSAVFKGKNSCKESIYKAIEATRLHREAVQPVREKTGGSTFKNPSEKSAWKEIDKAGCRGLIVGKAKISSMHCNFMVNTGGATAYDLEYLGEMVRLRVLKNTGTLLEWEIKRIGEFGNSPEVKEFLGHSIE